jgi:hypothetical protein
MVNGLKKTPGIGRINAVNRRDLLRSAATAAGLLAAAPALGKQMPDPPGTTPPPRNWQDPASAPYPDAAFEVFDHNTAGSACSMSARTTS